MLAAGYGLSKAVPALANGKEQFDNLQNAKTDKEALDALHNMGSSAVDVAQGGLVAAMGTKTAVSGVSEMARTWGMANSIALEEESVGVNFLKNFASEEQIEAANKILNNTDATLSEHMTEYYASNFIEGVEESAAITAGIDLGITTALVGSDAYKKMQDDARRYRY